MNRSQNLSQAACLIWKEGEISRAEVARRLDLSRSTVSSLVQQLIDQGTVFESRVGRSSGGRPPVLLRFAHNRYHMIGLDLGMTHITAISMNPRGDVLAREHRLHDVEGDPVGALAALTQMLDALCASGPAGSHLLGIGVAVPCPVHTEQPGQLSPSILPRWQEINLGALLTDRFDCPVYLENDANLGALGELYWGQGRDIRDFVYVKLATGVGAGLIINGDIYHGTDGIAGEIGHTSLDVSGPPCRCGLRGCLVTMIGSSAIEARYRQVAPLAAPLELSAIASAAAAGEPAAREVIEHAARCLGVGLANLLNIINPARIILGGRLTLAGQALLTPLSHAIQGRALWTNVEVADVVISTIADDIIPTGAATLVLRTALADPTRFTHGLPIHLPRHSPAGGIGIQPTP